jgi:hypothetical protein
MWIDCLPPEVQGRGLWDSADTINRTGPWGIADERVWENPARITRACSIQIWLIFVNGLLSFNNLERIVAGLPHPLMKG